MDESSESSRSLTEERERSRRGRARDPQVDEAILAAAVDLLAEIGYARLTMDQIAARARVGKASVYLRWPNKVALVAEAIHHRSAVAPDVPDTGSLREDMHTFLRALLRSKSSAQRAIAAVTGEIASNPELAKAWRQGVAGTLLACTREIVDRAIARGELPAAPDDALVDRIVAQFFTPARPAPERMPHGEAREESARDP